MINIFIYQSKAENIRLNKTDYLTLVGTYPCVLKDSTSILAPVIELAGVSLNKVKGNYAYIPDFERYYFITNITSVKNGLWLLHLSVDVLMSFKDQIINLNCIVERNQYKYTPYLTDSVPVMTEHLKVNDIKKYELYPQYTQTNVVYGYAIRVITLSQSEGRGGAIPSVYSMQFSPQQASLNKFAETAITTYIAADIDTSYTDSSGLVYKIIGISTLKKLLAIDSQHASYVISIVRFPFSIKRNLSSTEVRCVKFNIGNDEIRFDKTFHKFGGNTASDIGNNTNTYFSWVVQMSYPNYISSQILFSDFNLSNDFTDYSPYTKYSLYLPYYGGYELNIKDIISFSQYQYNKFMIRYVYELDSGNCSIYICVSRGSISYPEIPIDVINCIIGEPVDINSSTSDQVNRQKMVNELARDVETIRISRDSGVASVNAVTGFITNSLNAENTNSISTASVGIASAALKGIGDFANIAISAAANKAIADTELKSKEIINIPYGIKSAHTTAIFNSFMLYQNVILLIIYKNDIINDNYDLRYSLIGRSYSKTETDLKTTYGFTILSGYHLENFSTALESEKQAIDKILSSGFILPNPPST